VDRIRFGPTETLKSADGLPEPDSARIPATAWPRPRDGRFGQFLGWVDLNLIALVARIVLRPFFRAPPLWFRPARWARSPTA
jgi:hypothetical protein